MTVTEGYLLTFLAGGSWTLQVLLERNGKDSDAQIAQAVGYGAVFAMLVKLGLAVVDIGKMFGVWWL